MQNHTRLLERHTETLAHRKVLVVGADDAELGRLPAAQLSLHSDRFDVAGAAHDLLPRPAPDTDLAVLVMPKSREQLRFWLAALAGHIEQGLECWLVGPTKGGVKGGATDLEAVADDVTLLDSARHCKLYAGNLRPAPFDPAAWSVTTEIEALPIMSWPGVFSHGRLDEGTALLLDAMRTDPPSGSVLDIGCGAGVLTLWLAARGAPVTAVDQSAAAVAATRASLEAAGLEADVRGGDVYQGIENRFDAIVTNPPFHDGTQQTFDISRRLILDAPRHLRPGGVLWLVANRGLPYDAWLEEAFSRVRIVEENRRFRVWKATL